MYFFNTRSVANIISDDSSLFLFHKRFLPNEERMIRYFVAIAFIAGNIMIYLSFQS